MMMRTLENILWRVSDSETSLLTTSQADTWTNLGQYLESDMYLLDMPSK
jgi:hypothetical protein